MGKYLFMERRLPVSDIVVAITKLDMCRYRENKLRKLAKKDEKKKILQAQA